MENPPPSPTPEAAQAGQTAAAGIPITPEITIPPDVVAKIRELSRPADVAKKMHDLSDQITGLRRSNLENASKLLDTVFKANENGASFYEKLILFDVGTIVLSLTLLGQIIAHTPGAHVPRHPFLWFLCPAWFLLLISINCCTRRMVSFHHANIVLIKQISALAGENYIQDVTVLVSRIPAVVGEIAVAQGESQTLREVLTKSGGALLNAAKENTGKANELIQKAVESDKKTGIAARIGIIATTMALLLICIFAIESILRM